MSLLSTKPFTSVMLGPLLVDAVALELVDSHVELSMLRSAGSSSLSQRTKIPFHVPFLQNDESPARQPRRRIHFLPQLWLVE